MADISGNLKDWSTTAASNNPSGATTIGTGLDDNLRELQKVVRQDLAHKGADIASAATTDLGAVAGLMHDITGTTTITSFGTVAAGIWKILKFEGALTLTHNATSLILPGGGNITTANGDVGIFMSEGSGNWRCLSYEKASGASLGGVLSAEVASTSGTAVDFTGIPAGVKRITVMFVGVSTSGTSIPMIQIGDSGGVETSGYSGGGVSFGTAPSVTISGHSTGWHLAGAWAAGNVAHGAATLTLQDSSDNTWVMSGNFGRSDAATAFSTAAGSKALSATLDRVRVTMVNGTDTFDAGAISIMYE